ncbi:ribosome-associated translation inhibitor RaiA [Prosthecobacter sp.]|uniref:ribosome hibernation-promoting factor, HPF/YfiA family n=1 Tax=Prosthecobacter sp. TaxID=1965333 RepID=UPI001D65B3C3|nr:ribosome-associated translation inhibitor RaiA [Prosthecobacter sp.]MCB1277853.1 ribosome-associated translation inhibitor RaiA [Prosthecobacter sp.]
MQKHNVNLPIIVTARHMDVTEAIRDYAHKKVESLHLDYPRIIEAKVILDVQNHRHQIAEIILFCADHIVIEVKSTSEDVYASIDESIAKIARRMRKYKTRLLKNHRPRKEGSIGSIRHLEEHVFHQEAVHAEEDHLEPSYVHKEAYKIRPLYADEAIMDLEISDRPFVLFHNQQTHRLAILFRRKDGDYGLVEPEVATANGSVK